ncbi:hypothetical protein [Burkholderia sp. S-53]|uniref:hypothetical protein n=1 Tax=Burkholderia sp. S-53 TaxID=2906514 RepID=UPI0021D358C3|nr:hypothetical protein [Burkholderia sp. S-53]UXU85747.1 hypothetical protein LXM88_00140 [Burkholderia sp. S-53]
MALIKKHYFIAIWRAAADLHRVFSQRCVTSSAHVSHLPNDCDRSVSVRSGRSRARVRRLHRHATHIPNFPTPFVIFPSFRRRVHRDNSLCLNVELKGNQ